MLVSSLPRVRCRQIRAADTAAVVGLLGRGFQLRPRDYWQRALATLAAHPTPEGLPKFGYLLESDERLVGVILLIFSAIPAQGAATVRCNISSWYVEPDFRSYAALLISQAMKHKNVTYVNISPAMHTRPIIEAQGFAPYSRGQFVTLPALAAAANEKADIIAGDPAENPDPVERNLMRVHRAYGCLGLWCVTAERAYPFVFMPRLVKGAIPCAQLIYCRGIDDFVQFARPLGRHLAVRGRPFVIVDSNGPVSGLPGRYFDGKSPKYFKGLARPSFGDLAYTEAVMFGL
jgi:hypothetical protein